MNYNDLSPYIKNYLGMEKDKILVGFKDKHVMLLQKAKLNFVDNTPYYFVERYDRQIGIDNKIVRIY